MGHINSTWNIKGGGALHGLKTIIIIQENWDGHNNTTSTDALLIAK